MLLDSFFPDTTRPVKGSFGSLSAPFYWFTDIPSRLSNWFSLEFSSRKKLQEDNEALHGELLIVKQRLQQMAALAAENVRLRQLMNSAEMIQDRVLVAELIGVSPDPLAQTIVINKGATAGVYVGQPLLDAYGLMGQVIEVSSYSSRVLLITDSTHAIPVQVNRNGVRAVAQGIGDLYQLELRHVANTVDIRAGDLLVSSGLGSRFPVGYPVAEIREVIHDPGQPFATVLAEPKAQMNRSRHVLLAFSDIIEQGDESEGKDSPATGSSTEQLGSNTP